MIHIAELEHVIEAVLLHATLVKAYSSILAAKAIAVTTNEVRARKSAKHRVRRAAGPFFRLTSDCQAVPLSDELRCSKYVLHLR